jgi:hypothetical protein
VGVAVFSSTFFLARPAVEPALALSAALTVQTIILLAFSGVTLFFPINANAALEAQHG